MAIVKHTNAEYPLPLLQSIGYSDGQDVRFASATKLEAMPDRVCRGGWGTRTAADRGSALITALAFDALSPGTLYTGSETGDVLVSSLTISLSLCLSRCLLSLSLSLKCFVGLYWS